jgi:urease accessory protein
MEGFYVGLIHPLVEIVQGLAIVAAGLLIGQQAPDTLQSAWLAFAVAFALGLGAAWLVGPAIVPDSGLFAAALLCGGGVALARRLPRIVSIVIAAGVGGVIGIRAMPDPGPWRAMAFTICGGVAGVNLLLFYAIGAAHLIRGQDRRPWLQIGLRVFGSWIVAASALMLALAARG